MTRKKMVFSVVLILATSLYAPANVFVACCDDHVDTVKAYLDSLKDLVVKVKAENVEQFFRKSHKQEGLTYLKFVSQSSLESVQHYNQMILKSDESIKNLEEFKLSAKAMDTLQKRAQQLVVQIKAAKDDKEAKLLLEKINLELK